MGVKTTRVKDIAILAPMSLEEVSDLIRQLGERHRKIDTINTKLNEQVEKLKAEAMEKTQPEEKEIEDLFERIRIFAESHREELTEGGKTKTCKLPTGEIYWRFTPPAVTLRDVKKVIEQCKERKLKQFLRIKEEVDKQAMLKEPDVAKTIKGVTIEQKEEFVVKPSDLDVEISKIAKKPKK